VTRQATHFRFSIAVSPGTENSLSFLYINCFKHDNSMDLNLDNNMDILWTRRIQVQGVKLNWIIKYCGGEGKCGLQASVSGQGQ
jgi:hypothetical protein